MKERDGSQSPGQMRPIPRFHLILLLLLPHLGACSTGTDPGPCEEVECRRITDIMVVQRGVFLLNDSLRPFFTAAAVFGQKPGLVDQHLVHGGSGGEGVYSVELNGIELRRSDLDPPAEGYSYHLQGDYTDSVLAPPGEWNRWVVRRGFDDSAHFEFRTPNQRPKLAIAPTYADDTLSADQDLHITWPPGSVLGEERNSVYIFLRGDSGTRVLSYSSPEDFFFTDQAETTIPRDSLKTWSSRFHSMQIQLEHYSMRDTAFTESSWARTVILDRDVRLLHFPAP